MINNMQLILLRSFHNHGSLRYDTVFRTPKRSTTYHVLRYPHLPPPPPPPPLPRWPPRRRGHSGCRLTARWPCGDREEAVEVAGQSRGGWYRDGRRRRAPRTSPRTLPRVAPAAAPSQVRWERSRAVAVVAPRESRGEHRHPVVSTLLLLPPSPSPSRFPGAGDYANRRKRIRIREGAARDKRVRHAAVALRDGRGERRFAAPSPPSCRASNTVPRGSRWKHCRARVVPREDWGSATGPRSRSIRRRAAS